MAITSVRGRQDPAQPVRPAPAEPKAYQAFVAQPPPNFLDGITQGTGSSELMDLLRRNPECGKENSYQKILRQWCAYVEALREAGVEPVILEDGREGSPMHPDRSYVQDQIFIVSVQGRKYGILANPGHQARAAELADVKAMASKSGIETLQIEMGHIEIGDIVPDWHSKTVFVGITAGEGKVPRTDDAGAAGFADVLGRIAPEFTVVGLKHEGSPHLGTHFTVIGKDIALCDPNGKIRFDMPYVLREGQLPFKGLTQFAEPGAQEGIIMVPESEGYAANVLVVNGFAIVPEGYDTVAKIVESVYGKENTKLLDFSESREMDGSSTCWSALHFELRE